MCSINCFNSSHPIVSQHKICLPLVFNILIMHFSLAHFLGDISQPLHNCNRDVGGNSDKIVFNGAQTNFHSIHDSEIPQAYAVEKGFSSSDAVSVANYLDGIYGKNKGAYTTSTFIDLKTVDAANNLIAAIVSTFDSCHT